MDSKPRALTQKQIAAQKAVRERRRDSKYVVLYNRSAKHPLPLQLRAPEGIDFYIGEQSVRMAPGEQLKFPAQRLIEGQISNLIKMGRLTIISGREHLKI